MRGDAVTQSNTEVDPEDAAAVAAYENALRAFTTELKKLHIAFGAPSYATIASSSVRPKLTKAGISEALSGKRLPSREALLEFVRVVSNPEQLPPNAPVTYWARPELREAWKKRWEDVKFHQGRALALRRRVQATTQEMLEQAVREAASVRAVAQEEAARIRAEAKEQADALCAQAREQAAQMIRSAQADAEAEFAWTDRFIDELVNAVRMDQLPMSSHVVSVISRFADSDRHAQNAEAADSGRGQADSEPGQTAGDVSESSNVADELTFVDAATKLVRTLQVASLMDQASRASIFKQLADHVHDYRVRHGEATLSDGTAEVLNQADYRLAPPTAASRDSASRDLSSQEQSANEVAFPPKSPPFWFLVPNIRPLLPEDGGGGAPFTYLRPGRWYVALGQSGSALVVQTHDGRQGILHQTADLQIVSPPAPVSDWRV
jgi:hypothetical protein